LVGVVSYHWSRRRGTGKLGARQPPSSPLAGVHIRMEGRQGAGRRWREGGDRRGPCAGYVCDSCVRASKAARPWRRSG